MSADGMDQQDSDHQNADMNEQPESSGRPSDTAAEKNALDQLREETSQAFPSDADGTVRPDALNEPQPAADGTDPTQVDLFAPTDYERTVPQGTTLTGPEQAAAPDESAIITEISEWNVPTDRLGPVPSESDDATLPAQPLNEDISTQPTAPLDGGQPDYTTEPMPTEPLPPGAADHLAAGEALAQRADHMRTLAREGAPSPLRQEYEEHYRRLSESD